MSLNVKNRTLFTGDNLDVLRGINSDSVDLIYLDPPFNSNKTYEAPIGSEAAGAAFKDAWTLDDVDIAWIGILADKEPALASIIESAGLSHGKGMPALYGRQEGQCAGCKHHFPFRNLTVDHITPRSKGGTDHLDNLQMLCGACNSSKGTIDQATFVAKLKAQGIRD